MGFVALVALGLLMGGRHGQGNASRRSRVRYECRKAGREARGRIGPAGGYGCRPLGSRQVLGQGGRWARSERGAGRWSREGGREDLPEAVVRGWGRSVEQVVRGMHKGT